MLKLVRKDISGKADMHEAYVIFSRDASEDTELYLFTSFSAWEIPFPRASLVTPWSVGGDGQEADHVLCHH